jgi:uncharacterized membrane protein YfcA
MVEFIFLVTIVFLAALTNSTFGFGFNLVSMSLLTLYFDLAFIAPLIPLLLLSTNLVIVYRARKEIRYRSITMLMLGATLAIPIGLWIGQLSSQDPTYECIVKVIVGLLLIGLAIFNLLAPTMPHIKTDKAAPIFGFFSGLFGGAYNMTGPPIVIYGLVKHWDPQAFRATLQGYFTYVTTLLILGHLYAGNMNNPKLGYFYLGALPAVLIAAPIGKYINGKFKDPDAFRKYVYYIMLVLGGVMILKAFNYI